MSDEAKPKGWADPEHPAHQPASGVPAGGDDRRAPPFPEGNTAAMKHGANSEKIVSAEAEGIVERLKRELGLEWVQAADKAALTAWARAEARVKRLHDWLQSRPPVQPDGESWPAALELVKWENRAHAARQVLGLDPLSRSRLGLNTAQARQAHTATLERMEREGTAAGERRAALEVVPDDADEVEGGSDVA